MGQLQHSMHIRAREERIARFERAWRRERWVWLAVIGLAVFFAVLAHQ